jgi:hypothetical protein
MECPDCYREMAIILLGNDEAYDECDCGTMSETYDIKDDAEFGLMTT